MSTLNAKNDIEAGVVETSQTTAGPSGPSENTTDDRRAEGQWDDIPDIIVSPPSTPSLVLDDTPGSDEDIGSPLTPSFAGWNLTECLKTDLLDAIAENYEEAVQGPDTPVVDALFDEVESYVSGDTPTLLATIPEEDSSDLVSEIASDTSVPSISDLLAEISGDETTLSIDAREDPVDIQEEGHDRTPSYLEVPPTCHTQSERDAAVSNSRYPRFVVTQATLKRSALKSPVQVNWKKFKRSVSLPNFMTGVALTSKNKLISITEAAKGKSIFAKRARRDVPYIWPSEEDGDKDVKRSSTARF